MSDELAHPAECELSEHAQRKNSLVFIINTSVSYFVAPVFYVGILHAAILSSHGFSDTLANLPESVYMWMLPIPLLIAWLWPSGRHFHRILVTSYLCKASAGLGAAALFYFAPRTWLAYGIVAHAAVIGVTNGVANMCLWELLGRGMTQARRGWTLGITFGLGPILAVFGSCASQLILQGDFLGLIQVTPLAKPWCYVVLFGVTGPAMCISAAAVVLATLPPDPAVERRGSAPALVEGLRQYFLNPLILIAVGGFLLTSAGGNMILNNMALYVRDVTGKPAEEYAGLQLALRFGCKSLFGFVLGWLLARHHAKTPALATTLICLAGVIWALVVPGEWYLVSFGLAGAGELYYVYYLNYIVGCSRAERVRENTAYTNVLQMVVGFVPLAYGVISDYHGIRASFYVASGILVIAIGLVGTLLPRQSHTPLT